MKKFTICALALLTVVAFTACTKDGVYRPSKKISRVYSSSKYKSEYYVDGYWQTEYSDESPKSLRELWHWDGNKLTSIDYYYDGSKDYTLNLTYDGGKLSRMDNYGAGRYVNFIYKGNELTKIEAYYEGSLTSMASVTHKGGKITQIDWTSLRNDKKSDFGNEMMFSALRVVMPGVNHESARASAMAAKGGKGDNTFTFKYTWSGGNVSEMVIVESNERVTISMTYDSKNNPFNGFLYYIEDEGTARWGSKNNVVREQSIDDDGDVDVTNYTYNYDGNWPVMKMYTYKREGDTWRYTSTYTEYYEYDD